MGVEADCLLADKEGGGALRRRRDEKTNISAVVS